MVDTKKATGGGDVPALEFKVIEEGKEIVIEGVKVLPIAGEWTDPVLTVYSLVDGVDLGLNSSPWKILYTTNCVYIDEHDPSVSMYWIRFRWGYRVLVGYQSYA